MSPIIWFLVLPLAAAIIGAAVLQNLEARFASEDAPKRNPKRAAADGQVDAQDAVNRARERADEQEDLAGAAARREARSALERPEPMLVPPEFEARDFSHMVDAQGSGSPT